MVVEDTVAEMVEDTVGGRFMMEETFGAMMEDMVGEAVVEEVTVAEMVEDITGVLFWEAAVSKASVIAYTVKNHVILKQKMYHIHAFF